MLNMPKLTPLNSLTMVVWYLLLTALQVSTCQGYPQHRHDHHQRPRAAYESTGLEHALLIKSFRAVSTGVEETVTVSK